ncbi:MAG: protein translocase subunit SecF [Candidatus Gracilibacteria bacterium]|nr:protein translocase subunit SecF [Candidatus Gracilibacteria bacterium]
MKLNVIKNRFIYLSISGMLFIASLIIMIFGNLNLGIDMTGGTSSEYTYSKLDIEKVKTEINNSSKELKYNEKEVINSTNAYKISGQNSLTIVVGFDSSIDEKKLSELKEDFRNKTLKILENNDSTVRESSYTNIGKSFGDYIKDTAVITLIIAIICITLYVAWTFSGVVSGISSYSFAAIVVITLFHDVLISSGLYIFASNFFPEFKIDTFFITALLTILGYSINDTIVIFDRIRSNLQEGARKKEKLNTVINKSIGETLRRSIFTSLTLLFVLTTTFFWGPGSISGFVLVMIFGTLVGTYSSIFIASPLLYEMNKNKKLEILKKKVYNPEDKIVV